MKAPRDYSGEAGPRKGVECFPIAWNQVIEKESLNINKLEHALIEKVEHFFGTCSSEPLNCSSTQHRHFCRFRSQPIEHDLPIRLGG